MGRLGLLGCVTVAPIRLNGGQKVEPAGKRPNSQTRRPSGQEKNDNQGRLQQNRH